MIQKQEIDISFAKGLDTKTDPKRVPIGKFLQLENTVFDKGGLLQKRNGYGRLASLPNTSYSYVTTFKDNLTAIGPNIAAYNTGGAGWVSKGTIQPLSVSTLPLIRNNLNQTAVDAVIAPNGLVCTVYLESDGSTTTNKYAIADSVTGQNIVAPTVIPVTSGTVSGGMRVFVLANNFVIVFTNTITATPHLQYVMVNSNNPTVVGANTDIASSYVPATTLSWDGCVIDNRLIVAYNTTSGGQSIKVTAVLPSGTVLTPLTFAAEIATMVSVTGDTTNPVNPIAYVSYYDATSDDGFMLAVNLSLHTVMAPEQIILNQEVLNITSVAQNGVCRAFYEVDNAYGFDATIPTNYVEAIDVTLSGPTVGAPFVSLRSVGLGSKAFLVDGVSYYLAAYESAYQPTYFLINGTESTEDAPVVAGKLAYQDGGGYLPTGLPGVTVIDMTAYVPYLFKDLIQAVNKNTNVPAGSQTAGIYSQTGINLGTFVIGTDLFDSAEIGNDLHLSGGFLWMYDGYLPLEHGFFLYPDMDATDPDDMATWSESGGSMAAQPDGATNTDAYYYQIVYEWTDNQGNAFRSAPSVPIPVTTTGSGTAGSVELSIPTLRVTMKTANPVKIVIYRWSVAQQNYFQVTSITSPLLNDTAVDEVTFLDTLPDASILGNNLIYTTGGVIENIAAPATNAMTLFDSRFWQVDAEDPDNLWFSKQVIQATPVEMSDLLTIYVPPNTGTETSTGPIKTLSVMDDKLILGKKNAFLYINGTGPDNTGANNQYSPATFITSTVGCDNQRSIVLTPQGLMFESNKGIWLLARDLTTSYIGAPVQEFTTGASVVSAVTVPETNQVRFNLDSGVTLMYDYYYDEWGSFTGVPSLSSCIYQGLHTYINSFGATYQETPGAYLDGSNPVLMRFKTGPLRLGELQGYQRAYFFFLLGDYISPFKMELSLYYDYAVSPEKTVLITPINYSTPFGSGSSQSPFGQGSPFGGPADLLDWRIFTDKQRCQAFSIGMREIFDSSFGTAAGAGFTLSGLNVVCGFKKGYRPQAAAVSAG